MQFHPGHNLVRRSKRALGRKPAVSGLTAIGLGLAALVAGQQAYACASCGCTLSKDWLGPQAGSVSGWSAGISYDYINQNEFRIGTSKIDYNGAQAILNPGVTPPGSVAGNEVELQTATRTTTLTVDYNAADWGVSVLVPFVDKYHTTFGDGTPDGYAVSDYKALGDVKVIGRYAGWSSDHGTGITFGVQLPTGRTDETFRNGDALDASLQPGTGTTALLLGAFTSGQIDNWGWFTQGVWQQAISETSTLGYKPGNSLIVNAGVRYSTPGQTVVPLLQLNLVHRASDSGAGASTSAVDGSPLSGGKLAYLAPGVSANLGAGISAYGYVQIPIYQDVKGVQLTPKYILSAGLKKYF